MSVEEFLGGVRILQPSAENLRDPHLWKFLTPSLTTEGPKCDIWGYTGLCVLCPLALVFHNQRFLNLYAVSMLPIAHSCIPLQLPAVRTLPPRSISAPATRLQTWKKFQPYLQPGLSIKNLLQNAGIVTTPTQPQLNSKVGFDTKRTLHHHPPTHHHHTNSMSSISQLFLTQF